MEEEAESADFRHRQHGGKCGREHIGSGGGRPGICWRDASDWAPITSSMARTAANRNDGAGFREWPTDFSPMMARTVGHRAAGKHHPGFGRQGETKTALANVSRQAAVISMR